MATMTGMGKTILRWIEEDRNKLIGFLSRFVQIASPNPPGDTRQAAAFLHDTLKVHGVPAEYRSARAELPNVVGTFAGAGKGPHLVLNGQIIHENLEVGAPTGHVWRLPEVRRGPLLLQAARPIRDRIG